MDLRRKEYMIEDRKNRHRNKPDRMSGAEIMAILILSRSGGFRCFKHYYKEYVCKRLPHLFPGLVFQFGISTKGRSPSGKQPFVAFICRLPFSLSAWR